MKRSQMLRILARRLSNRDVEDIYEAALDEMEFVQTSVLERLPNQPWFAEKEVILEMPAGNGLDGVALPDDYNGLMTHGGVWIKPGALAPACTIIDFTPSEDAGNFVTVGSSTRTPLDEVWSFEPENSGFSFTPENVVVSELREVSSTQRLVLYSNLSMVRFTDMVFCLFSYNDCFFTPSAEGVAIPVTVNIADGIIPTEFKLRFDADLLPTLTKENFKDAIFNGVGEPSAVIERLEPSEVSENNFYLDIEFEIPAGVQLAFLFNVLTPE